MKKIIIVLLGCFSFSYVHAASCTNLTSTLVRYQETSSVLSLQKYLFEKGFLKATPNGYFGVGTFNAVKKYQKSIGLAQVGVVGPATRAAIKKDTCQTTTISTEKFSENPPIKNVVATTTPVLQPITPPPIEVPKSPQTIRNSKRKEDATLLLQMLYRYYVDSRGVVVATTTDTPMELCVKPPILESSVASGTESNTLITKNSPCEGFIDISYLSPGYLSFIPRDPNLATSSIMTGYTVTRSQYNDITIAAKNAEEQAIIKVTCNFNNFCKDIVSLDKEVIIYGKPSIATLTYNTLVSGATPKTSLIITGKNFTTKNSVKLISLYTLKEYPLGDFSATVSSATNTKISIEGDVFNKILFCGSDCSQKIPLGSYAVIVTNEGGGSNAYPITIQGITISTTATHDSTTIIPKSKNVKVATFVLSSTYLLSLRSLTLTSSSTSTVLPSKLSNFVLKDTLDGTTYSGGSGGAFNFSNVILYANHSKIYDLYIDVDEVELGSYGFMTYGGKFLVHDDVTNIDMESPIKTFPFTVSY